MRAEGSDWLLFDYQTLDPVARRRFADPKRFAHTQDGRIGIPPFSIILVNYILLVVAIEQVDHIAFVNRKAEVGMQPTRFGNL